MRNPNKSEKSEIKNVEVTGAERHYMGTVPSHLSLEKGLSESDFFHEIAGWYLLCYYIPSNMTRFYFKDIVQFYPYRSALAAGDKIFSCRLQSEDISELRKTLTHKGFALDNHICWRTENACFMYSDNVLRCCTDLLVEKW